MNGFTLMALLTGTGTIVSFMSGVRAMIRSGQVGHKCSAEWMVWRVVFQGRRLRRFWQHYYLAPGDEPVLQKGA